MLMTIQKFTEAEFQALNKFLESMQELNHLVYRGGELYHFIGDKDINLDDAIYDIKNDTLFEAIKRFKDRNTKLVAIDSEGVGFHVVEILHNDYDNVFGYVETNEGNVYYYCETKDSWNEELERDEIHFFVDEIPVCLSDCIRV